MLRSKLTFAFLSMFPDKNSFYSAESPLTPYWRLIGTLFLSVIQYLEHAHERGQLMRFYMSMGFKCFCGTLHCFVFMTVCEASFTPLLLGRCHINQILITWKRGVMLRHSFH